MFDIHYIWTKDEEENAGKERVHVTAAEIRGVCTVCNPASSPTDEEFRVLVKEGKKKPYKHATSSFILHKIIAFDPLTFLKLPSPHFYHSRNSNLWVSDVHSIIRKYWMKMNKFYNFNRQQTNKIFSKIIIFGH